MENISTTGFEQEPDSGESLLIPLGSDSDPEHIIECPVCIYWSERLEDSRAYALSASEAIGEEKRLLAILRQHQVEGACVRRLPFLIELSSEPDDTRYA